ncbi:MAG: segregation/condensation protein A, partial [Calditrichaeota bacterium]|nr:segregation/condensation protein A [Calditrichota bacterium]
LIRTRLNKQKMLYFSQLMKETPDKIIAVVTFITILELTKTREIDLVQERTFDDICITKAS